MLPAAVDEDTVPPVAYSAVTVGGRADEVPVEDVVFGAGIDADTVIAVARHQVAQRGDHEHRGDGPLRARGVVRLTGRGVGELGAADLVVVEAPVSEIPSPPLGMAAVPAGFVPMRLATTVLSLARDSTSPLPVFAEITFATTPESPELLSPIMSPEE